MFLTPGFASFCAIQSRLWLRSASRPRQIAMNSSPLVWMSVMAGTARQFNLARYHVWCLVRPPLSTGLQDYKWYKSSAFQLNVIFFSLKVSFCILLNTQTFVDAFFTMCLIWHFCQRLSCTKNQLILWKVFLLNCLSLLKTQLVMSLSREIEQKNTVF